MKQEAKLTHMRHEVRKLELDNEKLRQTLKQKLNIKGQQYPNIAKSSAISKNDEFYDMIKDGFFEQMQAMN